MERALWSVVLVLVWIASITTLTLREFSVALVVGVPVAIVATKTRLALAGRWRLRAAWLRGVWALPMAVVAETFALWRMAFRGRPGLGELREVHLGHERSRVRQAIAILLLSATPGTVVVDVDRKANVARVHSLVDAEGALERAMRT